MNINELLETAKLGDMYAIEQVACYYLDNNNDSEAVKWFIALYEKGHLPAITMIMSIKNLLAYAESQIDGIREAVNSFEDAYKWATLGKADLELGKFGDDEDINIDILTEYEIAAYNLATSYFLRREYMKAKGVAAKINSTRGEILYGLITYQNSSTTQELFEGFNYMQIIENNVDYGMVEKDEWEEFIYTHASIYISMIYRQGLPEHSVYANTDKAVNVLNFANTYVKREVHKKYIAEELSLYKKKLFGGYKYIG